MPGTLTNYEQDGGFFCRTCLMDKPATEASPDPRYCQGCYEFLLKEAALLPNSKHPAWIPNTVKKGAEESHQNGTQTLPNGFFKGDTIPDSGNIPSIDGVINMSTLRSKKIEVDATKPPATPRTAMRGGPKQKALPRELIKQWAGEGMGSKAIASKLKSELGIKVSYKTIQRLLSGDAK